MTSSRECGKLGTEEYKNGNKTLRIRGRLRDLTKNWNETRALIKDEVIETTP